MVMLATFKLSVSQLLHNYENRLAISNNFYEKKYEFIKSNIPYLLYQTLYGGTAASLVGMGGGMVVTPIMFNWNADTKVFADFTLDNRLNFEFYCHDKLFRVLYVLSIQCRVLLNLGST
jgi:hypothetical protein